MAHLLRFPLRPPSAPPSSVESTAPAVVRCRGFHTCFYWQAEHKAVEADADAKLMRSGARSYC